MARMAKQRREANETPQGVNMNRINTNVRASRKFSEKKPAESTLDDLGDRLASATNNRSTNYNARRGPRPARAMDAHDHDTPM